MLCCVPRQSRRYALRSLFLGALLAAFANLAAAVAPVPAVRPVYFEHLGLRDGLSESSVQAILQDSQGYVWLSTESGLNRYDGYRVRVYHRERGNPNALPSDSIWSIAEDVSHDLWLATIGGGLVRWNRASDRFEQFAHDAKRADSLASDDVRTLLMDTDGRIWVGTLGGGLDLFDPRTGRARHFRHRDGDPHSLASDRVYALLRDHAGQIWVGTDGGLSRYQADRDEFDNIGRAPDGTGLSDPQVRALAEDHAGALWIGTLKGGLDRLEPGTDRLEVFRHDAANAGSLSHDRVTAILEDSAERLWVATANGLNLLARDRGSFVHYGRDADNPHSLRDNDVISLYQDRGGVLWVGTRSSGASHWNPNSWRLGHYRSAAFADTLVISFADDGADHVWVGTEGAGLIEIDTRSGGERRYGTDTAVRLSDDRVMSLLRDHRGNLWIGTMAGGLDRLDPATGRIQVWRASNTPHSLPADGVMSLYEDRHGMIWIGTFGGGIARFDPATEDFKRYPFGPESPDALSDARASAIVEDLLGNLWIGTAGGGLNLLDPGTGHFTHFKRDDHDATSLADNGIYALHVDRTGNLWVGTADGGLDRVLGSSADPTHVRFENYAALLPSREVDGIESDRADRLWISTANGLVRLDPKTRATRVFHEWDGLQSEDFDSNAHYQDRAGNLYFGGNNGFNVFAPAEVDFTVPPPRVVLTSVVRLNQALPDGELPGPGRPLKLGYDDKLVTFDFAALDFTSPANNRYAYRLDGFDSAWIDAGAAHRATYTNLDAGRYLLRVRAAASDGAWSPDVLTIPVEVAPSPWNTWWARIGYGLLLLGVAGLLWRGWVERRNRERRYRVKLEHTVRERTRELEARNAELQVLTRAKSDFVAHMSHELRTPMNGVLGLTSLLLDTRLDAAQRRFAEGIHRSADSLLAVVNDVLDLSKIEAGKLALDPTPGDIGTIVEHAVEVLAPRAAGKALEILIDEPLEPLPQVRVDGARLRQVLINLGGNAVKFTETGEVIFRIVPLARDGETLKLRFEVADTGIGIAAEHHAKIFEQFAQADDSTTRRFGGTGLGLAIARQIVESMGGAFALESAPGSGSTFSFELSFPIVAAALPLAVTPRLDGLRVLIAADHAGARRRTADALRALGARPTAVASLAQACLELRSSSFDAVLVDDPLPDGSAVSLLEHVDSNFNFRPRMVRLVSYANLSPIAQSTGGFDAELTKPLRVKRLAQALCERAHTGVVSSARVTTEPRAPRAALQTPAAPLARVLVVEDQAVNREVARGMLHALGIASEEATNGAEALERLATGSFDAVLMDCAMPVMDGFQTTRALRQSADPMSRLPVIALTADATPEAREACRTAGMDDYLSKPFNRGALKAVLRRWLPALSESAADNQATSDDAILCWQAATPVGETSETCLDPATLASLRALPGRDAGTLLTHVAQGYLADADSLLLRLERAELAGDSQELARGAHAWYSCAGHIGALALMRVLREIEARSRAGQLGDVRALLAQARELQACIAEELATELRKTA
jgi:signal transduction histidine kinase/ligand-binding sensor domain-containing protein/DNA-binding response OmpR family regulator/HPt (histidine-containing phosphotransfer) domain-containing protein